MKRLIKTIFLILVFHSFDLAAQETEPKLFFSGYVKNLHELSIVDKLEQLQWTTLLHNRLNIKYIPTEKITLRLELRNRIYYGDRVKKVPGFSNIIAQDNGVTALSWNLIDNNNMLFNTTIDRALINYNNDNLDISLGRQRVNWGMNLVWNPNDIFNTYNFLDFDYEERPGSDALRVQYYVGDFSKVEVAAKKGKSKNDYIIATLYKFNKWSYDIQLLTGIYQKDWVIGAGWAGNIKNAGFKGEVTYFQPYEHEIDTKNAVSASVSVDYAFKKGLYINSSILYTTSDIDNSSGSLENLISADINAKHLMPYKYSGFLQLSKEFSPILSSSLSVIYATTNHSVIAMPSINYSIANNLELNFTGQSFFEINDYRTLGNSLFIRLRWSF